jgi:hypothetical protein
MTHKDLEVEHQALLWEATDLTAEHARLKRLQDPAGRDELWRKLADHVARFTAFTDALRARVPPD